MAERGAALCFPQAELTADKLADAIRSLDPARRTAMSTAMQAFAKPEAAGAVVAWLDSL